MHEILHIAVLASTLFGAAAALVLVLWPLVAEADLAPVTKRALAALVILGALLLLVEWRWAH